MKNRFERLTKEEQKKAIEEYGNQNPNNKIVVKKVKNLRVLSVIGFIYAILSCIFDVLTNAKVFFYIFDGCLLVTCVFLFFKSRDLLYANVNDYLIKEKNKKTQEFYDKEEKKTKKKNSNE